MSNKQILRLPVDGLELAVSVFDATDSSKAGEVVVRLGADRASAYFYCTPQKLSEIADALKLAAAIAYEVEESGELPK